MTNTPLTNLLPYDGTVLYHGIIFSEKAASDYFEQLLRSIPWEADAAVMFGKTIFTKRKVAWFGDSPFSYTYSKVKKTALPWNEILLELKAAVEAELGETFNSCLLNLYHSGAEGMAWHSDGERDLRKNGTIASLSFGAERIFAFKHKTTGLRVNCLLQSGSLLSMGDVTQTHWLHRLPPTKKVQGARINLTFRNIDGQMP